MSGNKRRKAKRLEKKRRYNQRLRQLQRNMLETAMGEQIYGMVKSKLK